MTTLTTRCPNCGTAFRVQPTQLSARGGKVRCGKCGSVFDGVAALVSEASMPPPDAVAQDLEPSPQLALFEAARKTPLASAGDAANEEPAVPEFLDEPARPRRQVLWAAGVLLALVSLAAQAAFYFRTDLATRFPETRPHLLAACKSLGCDLRLPRRLNLIGIKSSELQAEGRRENVIVLNAVLYNQAPFAQEYPALELTLTDERDEPVARRVLLPADYLAGTPPERIAQGIDATADTALRLYLDTGGLRAIGYRMYLFFP